MSDLVEQLRSHHVTFSGMDEAADRIEELQDHVEGLDASLQVVTASLKGNSALMDIATARIEALEAALREIIWHDPTSPAAATAHAVLLWSQDK